MARPSDPHPEYLETLLLYHEEEIMGEAYFRGLKRHFERDDQREKLDLLSRVERVAAESVRAPIERHGLVPRPDAELAEIGVAWIGRHETLDWRDFVADMAERYPKYLLDFEALERMAPEEDRPAIRVLNDHEVAAIEFARKELAGDPDSAAPLARYIEAGPGGSRPGRSAAESG